ncbi:ABC transporter ATP-binding protein [Halorhodospira abdelmalekii]|uniref:energy-coupling factor ABC transporter ATP-binding protein n=1 Tax=Halorhodospira abdelmalekii TaxID=421629 RepID=UPI0019048706|nr:ABC transporter ATP-binding protein [Halorhodospira abdelmalekii]MBK1734473.1 ABC transporter ATP-binding protein [Halorhodospira abdelmalekii]
MTARLQAQGLAVAWAGQTPLLTGLDIALTPGERVGLVGPNGSGKSSLFLTLAGVLPAAAGGVEIDGVPVRPGTFNPSVGLVFQQAEDQLFCPTLAEDVAFGPRNLGLTGAALEARVAEALALCGLTDLAARPVHHLSGGEKRRACIAGVLALRPRLLLLDEPSAALDLRSRRRLITLLSGMEQTLVVASHDLEMILDLCSRVIVIDAGCIRADGPSAEILGDRALMEAHGQEVPASLAPYGDRTLCTPYGDRFINLSP